MHAPNLLVTILAFLLVIGPLIFLHELGHYLAGRVFGVHAEAFSIGFGREIVGWNDRRGTRWKIAWLPLGGYVRFAGDMNPASAPTPEWLSLPAEERNRTFQAKPMWQRFCIVAAGPVTNFLVAIAIFIGFFAIYGEPRTPNVVAAVAAGSPAERAGIRAGDRITMIARRGISSFENLADLVRLFPEQTVPIDVYRGSRPMHLTITPKRVVLQNRFGERMDIGQIGVTPGPQVIVPLRADQVVGAAVSYTGSTVVTMVQTLSQVITGTRSVAELGGPAKIAKYAGEQITEGWWPFIYFMAMISINLGFINLLPIPLLDGGHLFFYVLEGVRRRPLTQRTQEWAFRAGLAILLPFIVFVTFNDFGVWQRLAGLIG